MLEKVDVTFIEILVEFFVQVICVIAFGLADGVFDCTSCSDVSFMITDIFALFPTLEFLLLYCNLYCVTLPSARLINPLLAAFVRTRNWSASLCTCCCKCRQNIFGVSPNGSRKFVSFWAACGISSSFHHLTHRLITTSWCRRRSGGTWILRSWVLYCVRQSFWLRKGTQKSNGDLVFPLVKSIRCSSFIFKLRVSHDKAMCYCISKDSCSFIVADFIPMISAQFTHIITFLTKSST